MPRLAFAMQRVCCFSWVSPLGRLGQEKSLAARISADPGGMPWEDHNPHTPGAQPGVGKRASNGEAEKHSPPCDFGLTMECRRRRCRARAAAARGPSLPPFTPNSRKRGAPPGTSWPGVMHSRFLKGEPAAEWVPFWVQLPGILSRKVIVSAADTWEVRAAGSTDLQHF